MRGFSSIGLYQPKHDGNIGGAIRAATAYGSSMVVVGKRHSRRHGRIENTDTFQSHRHMPIIWSDDVIASAPHAADIVCVELCDRARPLPSFTHPQSAYYVFGPEDGSIPKQILDACERVVMVPTKLCMNLAATVNVVLYDRMAKLGSEAYLREAA